MKHCNHIFLILLPLMLPILSCSNEEKSDAYGQFEATEITISAEVGGKLLSFGAREGQRLEAGRRVGLIDTTKLYLKKRELSAGLEAARSRIANIDAEISVVKEELATASADLRRIRSLMEEGAATAKQLDDAQGRVNILQKRIIALQSQKRSARAEAQTFVVRIEQVQDQLGDAVIVNPVTGSVLETFVEPNELVGQGSPLYEIADLDTLTLRVYVSGARLPDVRLNREVEVWIDRNAEENRRLGGTVSWIASESEFTPKMIQTKEERVNQVYAVKVRVPNPDGVLKIGMPGEVNFE